MYKYKVPMFDESGKLLPYLEKARKRGIKFGLGHGLGNFNFPIIVPAVQQGWLPDAISTDLHTDSMIDAAKNITNLMSKMITVGMSLEEVIARTTWSPAQILNRSDLGHLTPGAIADVAVLDLKEDDFGYLDIRNLRMKGNKKLIAELTIREGNVVWDLNELAAHAEYDRKSMPPSSVH